MNAATSTLALALLGLSGCASHEAPAVTAETHAAAFNVMQRGGDQTWVFCRDAACAAPSLKHLASPFAASASAPLSVAAPMLTEPSPPTAAPTPASSDVPRTKTARRTRHHRTPSVGCPPAS